MLTIHDIEKYLEMQCLKLTIARRSLLKGSATYQMYGGKVQMARETLNWIDKEVEREAKKLT